MEQNPLLFVTGSSSGIGRACVKRLLQESFDIFATVRREADAEELVRVFGKQVRPLIMDLTDHGSIAAAAARVATGAGSNGLVGAGALAFI